jgi:hypothetical protein
VMSFLQKIDEVFDVSWVSDVEINKIWQFKQNLFPECQRKLDIQCDPFDATDVECPDAVVFEQKFFDFGFKRYLIEIDGRRKVNEISNILVLDQRQLLTAKVDEI